MSDKVVINAQQAQALREYIPPGMMTYPMEAFELRSPTNTLVAVSSYEMQYNDQNSVATFGIVADGTNWKSRIYIPAGNYLINLVARMNANVTASSGRYNLYINGTQVGSTLDYAPTSGANSWSMVTRNFTTSYTAITSGWSLVEIRDMLNSNPYTHYPYVSELAFIRKA